MPLAPRWQPVNPNGGCVRTPVYVINSLSIRSVTLLRTKNPVMVETFSVDSATVSTSAVGREWFGQRERGVAGQTRIGHGRDPGAVLGDEERIGVQTGGDSGRMQLVDHRLQIRAALGYRVGLSRKSPKRNELPP